MITVTDKAKEKIIELRHLEGKEPTNNIRVSVKGGGCSGLEYVMKLDTVRKPIDIELIVDGIERAVR